MNKNVVVVVVSMLANKHSALHDTKNNTCTGRCCEILLVRLFNHINGMEVIQSWGAEDGPMASY